MPQKKRQAASDERGGDHAAKKVRRRHLYLVLDDCKEGYSIRKLNLSSDDEDCQRLPRAVFRLEAPHEEPSLFAALGTKIVATHQTPRRPILLWDVSTRTLTFGPRHKHQLDPFCTLYFEVNGSLYFLDYGRFREFEPMPPPPFGSNVENVNNWLKLPGPPFGEHVGVVSYAVHPDERTVFFSTNEDATFSFHTESGEKWTRHGPWRLPFSDRGYFDPDLEAWVGLSHSDHLGHLCACEAVELEQQEKPSFVKLSKEKLFCVDPAEKHMGATLVYLGSGSHYCIVQYFYINDHPPERYDEWEEEEYLPARLQYLLRVTTFSLKYDRNGDLRAVVHGRVRSYPLSKNAVYRYQYLKNPVAFWI